MEILPDEGRPTFGHGAGIDRSVDSVDPASGSDFFALDFGYPLQYVGGRLPAKGLIPAGNWR